jgi:hypothetical protein
MIGDVHRAAFAPAVTGSLAQQLGKHPVQPGSFGQAMTMAAMGTGNVVVTP